MASGDVKNNVSGKPPKTVGKSYSGSGANNDPFVKNARSSAPGGGDYAHGGGGDQNDGYGTNKKRAMAQDPANKLSSVTESRVETGSANYKPNKPA